MKNDRGIKLKSYDDIFNTKEAPRESDIKHIEIDMLDGFRGHPFKLIENKDMAELLESIKENGILVPLLVRPLGDGRYEIVAGHRRKYCAEKARLKTVPCVVKDISYDEAVLAMIDSNIQRKNILPSEKAFSYKMKLDAIKRQGERTDLTSCQPGNKLNDEVESENGDLTSCQSGTKSAAIVGQDNNDSTRSVYRYIRLTELTPFLLEAVDNKKMSVGAGVEISYLAKEEQEMIKDVIRDTGKFPNSSQATQIKGMAGQLNEDSVKAVMPERIKEKKVPETERPRGNSTNNAAKRVIAIDYDEVKAFFPLEFTERDIELEILRLVKGV